MLCGTTSYIAGCWHLSCLECMVVVIGKDPHNQVVCTLLRWKLDIHLPLLLQLCFFIIPHLSLNSCIVPDEDWKAEMCILSGQKLLYYTTVVNGLASNQPSTACWPNKFHVISVVWLLFKQMEQDSCKCYSVCGLDSEVAWPVPAWTISVTKYFNFTAICVCTLIYS